MLSKQTKSVNITYSKESGRYEKQIRLQQTQNTLL
jgi:hypothetical protein